MRGWFFVFFGSQGLGSGPEIILQMPNMMGLIREPRKTWRRLGTSREAGEDFGRPGVTWHPLLDSCELVGAL